MMSMYCVAVVFIGVSMLTRLSWPVLVQSSCAGGVNTNTCLVAELPVKL